MLVTSTTRQAAGRRSCKTTAIAGGCTLHVQGFVADPQGPVLSLALTGGSALLLGD